MQKRKKRCSKQLIKISNCIKTALLAPLVRQVELGYVKGILARLDDIEAADPAYAAFVAEVRELTRNFRLEAIAPLLEKAFHA